MFFCEKCKFAFNITKDVKSKQIGGKINVALSNLFTKYLAGEKIEEDDLNKINGKNIVNDERFENMTIKDQRKFMSVIKAIDKTFFNDNEDDEMSNVKAFFICKHCANSKPIEPGTVIYSKSHNVSSSVESVDYGNITDDMTFMRTVNYICRNKKCKTHKDLSLREAVMTKNTSEQIVYVCTYCKAFWTSEI